MKAPGAKTLIFSMFGLLEASWRPFWAFWQLFGLLALFGCPWILVRLFWALLGRSWQPKTTFHETFENLHL